jgi:hypothetical protein
MDELAGYMNEINHMDGTRITWMGLDHMVQPYHMDEIGNIDDMNVDKRT